jgi:hypothetical protein
MTTQEITSIDNVQTVSDTATNQYTLLQILGIWAIVTLPMGLIYWVATPILIPRVDIEPGFLYLVLIALGLVWVGVVAFVILKREVRPFTWANIKDRVWLHTPTNPKTGAPSKWLLLWVLPLIVIIDRGGQVLASLDGLWVKVLPFLAPPPYTVIQNLADAENERRVREVGLYCQRRSVRGIPPAYGMVMAINAPI